MYFLQFHIWKIHLGIVRMIRILRQLKEVNPKKDDVPPEDERAQT